MVTERKELERNVLAQQLGRAVESIKQGPSRGTVIFLSVAAAAVLIYFVFHYFYQSSSAAASHRWLVLDEVIFPEQLSTVLQESDFKDTPQHRLARFKEARLNLSQGLRDLGDPRKRKEALAQIQLGTSIYEELINASVRVSLLHQEALWGAAKGYESLGGSANVEKAKELYAKLKEDYENSALGKDAKKQLARLNSESTKKDLRELARELSVSGKE